MLKCGRELISPPPPPSFILSNAHIQSDNNICYYDPEGEPPCVPTFKNHLHMALFFSFPLFEAPLKFHNGINFLLSLSVVIHYLLTTIPLTLLTRPLSLSHFIIIPLLHFLCSSAVAGADASCTARRFPMNLFRSYTCGILCNADENG